MPRALSACSPTGRGLLAGGDAAAAGARAARGAGVVSGAAPDGSGAARVRSARDPAPGGVALAGSDGANRCRSARWGADAELIAELEGLVASNPLQERPRAQLMLALYRAGRQAEALEVYRRTSELLRGGGSVSSPSRGLQELERQVLRQDPALELGPGAVTIPAERRPMSRRSVRSRGWLRLTARTLSISAGAGGRRRSGCPAGGIDAGRDRGSLRDREVLTAARGPSVGVEQRGALPGSASWRQLLVRPGERPCAELARALGGEGARRGTGGAEAGRSAGWWRWISWRSCSRSVSARTSVWAFLDRLASAACDPERRCVDHGGVARGLLRPLRDLTPVCGAAQLAAMCWSGRCDVRSWRGRSSCRRLALGWVVERALVERSGRRRGR